MTSHPVDTEEKIKEAAQRIFLEKGFDGTTIRDIAEAAQINTALTNYYFRSKEKLFWLVYESLLKEALKSVQAILDKPIGVKEKLVELLDHMFEVHGQNPNQAIFLMNECRRNPQGFADKIGINCGAMEQGFILQFEEEVKKGLIIDISPDTIFPLIFGLIQQIFAGRELTMHLFQMNEAEFNKHALEQKKIIKEMLLKYLFIE
ncbi:MULTISPECIES: TetR/AcrR family transcriptional regulator [unclassified Siphonobacter]|uniref:TetR/AcrR family transcriptional regulator n=1 Tax=unclassified Siphonobacter TaxID=2635712 RepID=UPI000CAE2023|nr:MULTISPECIES: TetR/AcrR family transcriptional regulator [unclassified Siphonobacter]MDQ1085747.1 TetR/AcrR family transcriptional regulator [Siphonobacter sp. SORGH_AS_1065]MDR6196016.1 TetR/AcrR family transcriptional regulator [Siphonobacter sp. SORGH_AS_0500]PKK37310.1 hypothetical protein BWI96_05365 [Siphonobacter sp. SORGH_AS_0500]